MRTLIHMLVSFQILGWVVYMVFAYLGPEDIIPAQSIESYLFFGIVALLLCFVPALRLSKTYEKQPIALCLAICPALMIAGTLTLSSL